MWIRSFVADVALALIATGASIAGLAAKKKPVPIASAPIDFGPCRDGSEFRQRHGTNCLCCHKEFGVAGSLAHDAGVATVLVTDRDGRELEIAPNPYDNFFRHHKMTPPLRAQIVLDNGEVRTMKGPAPHGSCNACHGQAETALGER